MASQKISLPAEVELVGVKNLDKIARTLKDAEIKAPITPTVRRSDINAFARSVREGLKEKSFNLQIGKPVGLRGLITQIKESLKETSFDINLNKANIERFTKDIQKGVKGFVDVQVNVEQQSLNTASASIDRFFDSKTVPLKFVVGASLATIHAGVNSFFQKNPVTVVANGIHFPGGLQKFLRTAFKNIDVPLNARIANIDALLKDVEARASGGDIAINLTIREKGLDSIKGDVENLEAKIKKITGGLRQTEFPVNVIPKLLKKDVNAFAKSVREGLKEKSFNLKLGNPTGIRGFITRVRQAINESSVDINVSKANLKNFSKDLQEKAGSVIEPNLKINDISLEKAALRLQKFFENKSIPLRFRIGSGLIGIRKGLNSYFKENPIVVSVGGIRLTPEAKRGLRDQFKGVQLPLNVRIANTEKLLKDIELQIASRDIPINVVVRQKGLGTATKEVKSLERNLKSTTVATEGTKDAMVELGEQTALTFRRFGIYTLVTAAFFKFTSAAKAAASEAIDFNDELVKIRQVTGESTIGLRALTVEVDRLATGLGVSSSELLGVSRTLSQAGFSLDKTRIILEAIAQSDLAATFDSMGDTVEGVVAITSQFNIEADKVSESLGAINAVSKQFAVESADLITTVRKTGGAFQAAGGNLEELIALFTSVRSTTRESADSIATGFRTIFTRLQRSRTQEFLANLNIQLRDFGDEAESLGRRGLFVGPFESIERLSKALQQIGSDDPRFAQITEELGGFRQVSKVIPLIQQFTKAQQALAVAERGRESLVTDAITRQEALANQFTKTREEFQKLIRGFIDTDYLRNLIAGTLSLTKALISMAEALQQVLFPLSLLATFKLSPVIASVSKGISGSLLKRNRGGSVPGAGNRDTVEALLTPGEYVLRKEAVKKIGVNRLDELNRAKFNTGGFVGKGLTGGAVAAGALVGLGAVFNQLDDTMKSLVTAIGVATTQFLVFNTFLKKGKTFGDIRAGASGLRSAGVGSNKRNPRAPSSRDALRGLSGSPEITSIPKIDKQLEDLTHAYSRNQVELENQTKKFQFLNKVTDSLSRTRTGLDLDSINKKNAGTFSLRKEEIEARQKLIQVTKQELVEAKKQEIAVVKEQVRQFRRQNLAQVLQVGVSAISAGLIAVGGLLEKWGRDELERLRSGEGDESTARRQFVGGSTIAGVGTGGLTGLVGAAGLAQLIPALAFFANPAFLAGAAALGAIGFGISSFFSSTREFEQTLKQINIEKIKTDFEKTFKAFEGGSVTAGSAGAQLGVGAASLNRQVQLESDPEVRKSLDAALRSNSVALSDFVNEVAIASSSLEEFEAKIPNSILETLSISSGETVEALKQNAVENIKNAQAASKLEEQNQKLSNQYQVRIREEQALTNALSSTVSKVGAISTSITDLPTLQNNVGQQLQNPNAIFDTGGFQRRLSGLASAFGESENLEKSILDTVKATQALPGILLSAQTSDPFGEGSDVRTIIGDQLKGAGVGQATRESIIAQVSNIIGAEAKDANLFSELDKDFTGTIKTITSQGVKFAEPLAQLGGLVNNELSALGQALGSVRANFERITDIELEKVDTREFLVGIRESIEGSPLLNLRQQNLNRRQNVLTGGRDAGTLLNERQRLQESLRGINDDLQNGVGSPADQQKLVNLQSQQVNALTRVNRGLEFLGDTAQRSSVLQSRLNQEIENRQKLRGVGDDIVFGGREDREGVARTIGNVQLARTQGINAVAGDERGQVLGFLESLGSATLPILGKAADEILNDIRRNALGDKLFDQLNDPTALERELQARIENMAEESKRIKTAIQDGLKTENKKLITGLNSAFDSFLANLRSTFVESQNRTIDQQVGALEASLSKVQSTQDAGREITGITGLDPSVVKNNIDSIREIQKALGESTKFVDNLKSVSSNLDVSGGGFLGSRNLADSATISLDDAGSRAERDLTEAGADQKTIDTVLRNIKRGGLASESSGGRISLADLSDGLIRIVNEIAEEEEKTLNNDRDQRDDIESRIGAKAFNSISTNISKLDTIFSTLPKDVTFENLSTNIKNLEEQIRVQNANRPTNPGGGAPGIDTSSIKNVTGGLDPALVGQFLPEIDRITKGLEGAASKAERASFVSQKNDLLDIIGNKDFNTIATNLNELNKIFANLPEDVRSSLTGGQRPVGRNSGGFIPGSGNFDTVPAMLTPGEFVLRKEAVKRLGPNYVQQLNNGKTPQKFRTGGLVKQNNSTASVTSSVDTQSLTAAINRFQTHVQQLSNTLMSIPSEITMRGEHNLNIRLNGAEVFRTMGDQFRDMVIGEISKQMNNMLRQKFPNAGQFTP